MSVPILRAKIVQNTLILTFTSHWANFVDEKLIIFFLIFPRKQDLKFHANGDSLYEMSNPVSCEK